ncbi:Crossover junction endonuclease mus81 [Coemansia sp. RSA 2611]|nr:Crossover junction endonuclease mus81 [Coemansia sp. RSA 2611]KAJ2405217.1 Crossover junction endonuclease mus81 [Coemansia sp. RSA 2530]KAJ2693274.1 Crossover junction endonuclease mus81 [Coemansia sp. IMI 209128]
MARPAIRCFSTDLPPLGCDVVHQPVAPAIGDLLVDSGCHTCSSLTHHARRFDLAPSGPCDCHVQDIACLGCGNVVGYYIHRPCFRCLAQRLRIKQRGFQHLWTFYQDNVHAVPRENDYGDPVGWEELPSPPAPAATAIRRVVEPLPPPVSVDSALIESTAAVERQREPPVSINMAARSFGEAVAVPPVNERRLGVAADSEDAAHRPSGRRAHWLMFMSQRVAAERILHNPRAGREARQEAMRTLAALREQEWDSLSRVNSSTAEPATLPPPRPSTQTTVTTHGGSGRSQAGQAISHVPSFGAQPPPLVALSGANRRDEAMEPLCPSTKPKAQALLPPAGLSNWLFQVGLDCMIKWEEISLSR